MVWVEVAAVLENIGGIYKAQLVSEQQCNVYRLRLALIIAATAQRANPSIQRSGGLFLPEIWL
jgi:hypothetical protein